MMSNPYRSTEPTLISFSGGRTSGYMLWKVLNAYDGELPDNFKVCFANTGKEMPETLNFVRDCQEQWNVDITWLEYSGRTPKPDDPAKYNYETSVESYATASRNGEPFRQLLIDVNGMPGAMARYCSGQLKIRTMTRYLKSIGWEKGWNCFIGIRADEPRRAAKLHNKISEGQDCFCPLYQDKVTKEDVGEFWAKNDFDLELPNNNGVTDWGNCDLCFLKGQGKRLSIIRERPDLADWWISMEEMKGMRFDSRGHSYEQARVIATDQMSMFDTDDETIPCFCGD